MVEQLKYKKIAALVSATMLIAAIPSIWPYAYFQLVRLVATASAAYIAWLFSQSENTKWMWIMIAVAIIHNPIVPFHMTKESWILFDIITASVFLLSLRVKD